jgi:hypothetical protein
MHLIHDVGFFFGGGLPDSGGEIGKNNAFQVVNFVLENASFPAGKFVFDRLTIAVLPFDYDMGVPFHLADQAGNR